MWGAFALSHNPTPWPCCLLSSLGELSLFVASRWNRWILKGSADSPDKRPAWQRCLSCVLDPISLDPEAYYLTESSAGTLTVRSKLWDLTSEIAKTFCCHCCYSCRRYPLWSACYTWSRGGVAVISAPVSFTWHFSSRNLLLCASLHCSLSPNRALMQIWRRLSQGEEIVSFIHMNLILLLYCLRLGSEKGLRFATRQ